MMTLIGSVVRHNQGIQGNHANQGSDNCNGEGAPFSQRKNRVHQDSDD